MLLFLLGFGSCSFLEAFARILPLVGTLFSRVSRSARAMRMLRAVVIIVVATISALGLIALGIASSLSRRRVRTFVGRLVYARRSSCRAAGVCLLLFFRNDEDSSTACWGTCVGVGGNVLSIGRGRRYASCASNGALGSIIRATAVWSRSELLFVCHTGLFCILYLSEVLRTASRLSTGLSSF